MTTVLHVLNDVRRSGNGIVNAVIDLACAQAGQGGHVLVASAGGDYVDLLAEHGVRHVVVDGIRDPRRVLPAAGALRAIVRDAPVDVVHAHMNYSTALCRLAVTGTSARLVATAHTSFKKAARLMTVADVVIAVGAAVAVGMRGRGVPGRKIRTVRNGTIGTPRASGSWTAAELDGPSVLCVAGLYERKGIDVLIDAFARVVPAVPGARLYLAGGGPDHDALAARAQATGVSDRISFLGYRDDVPSLLRGADVFVLPSRRDPFPLVVIEAREAGCAVVASAVDGIPEACDDGKAGWLFPVGDAAALAGALSALLTDPALLAQWRAAAAHGLEDYTVTRVEREVAEVYRELLAGLR